MPTRSKAAPSRPEAKQPKPAKPAKKATAPKVAAPTAAKPKPPPGVDKKLITQWRNLAKRIDAGSSPSAYKVSSQPGAWEALWAALDMGGQVSFSSLWRLGAFPGLPARFAVDALANLPSNAGPLWWAWQNASWPLLRRLQVEPRAFDELKRRPSPLPELITVAQVHAGIEPQGALPALVRDSIRDEFPRQSPNYFGLIRNGEVVKENDEAAALWELGSSLVGDQAFAELLAEGFRAKLASIPATERPFPSDAALIVASAVLSPEEVCRFQVRFPTLDRIAKRWSTEQLAQAAVVTAQHGGQWASLVASACGFLALERAPSLAERVQSALQISEFGNQLCADMDRAYRALRATPKAWLRGWLQNVVGPESNWSAYGRPLGLLLLMELDPQAAEAALLEDMDFYRVRALGPELLADITRRAPPRIAQELKERAS